MTRLAERVEALAAGGKKALVAFLTAGFPDMRTTGDLIRLFADNGVDIVELGVPFSDPVADGPAIQYSSEHALRGGTTLSSIIRLGRAVTKTTDMPLVLMSYLNPLLSYGLERLSRDARQGGISGCIVPDLIPEEGREVRETFRRNGLELIYLAAPNTPEERMRLIDRESGSFVYVVSLTGVTGQRKGLPEDVRTFLRKTGEAIRARRRYVGFGISNAEQARRLRDHADGIIVGSAFIEIIRSTADRTARYRKISALVKSLRNALDNN